MSLIKHNDYMLKQSEKETILTKILIEMISNFIEKNEYMRNFYEGWNLNLNKVESYRELPPIHVNLFKYFNLKFIKN